MDEIRGIHASCDQSDTFSRQATQQRLTRLVHCRDIAQEELYRFSVRLGLIAAGLDNGDGIPRELSINGDDRV